MLFPLGPVEDGGSPRPARRGSTPAEFFRYLSGTDTRIHEKIPAPETEDGHPVEGLRRPRSARRPRTANRARREQAEAGDEGQQGENGHGAGELIGEVLVSLIQTPPISCINMYYATEEEVFVCNGERIFFQIG